MKIQHPYRFASLLQGKVKDWLNQGRVETKPILFCQRGELILWRDGLISEVISVTPKGSSFVVLLHREEDGKLYNRILRTYRCMSVAVIKEEL